MIRYRRFGDDLLLLESANAGGDSGTKAASNKQAKNFATIVLNKKNRLLLYLHVDPTSALVVLPKPVM